MEVFLTTILGGVFRSLLGWLSGTKGNISELDWGKLIKTVLLAVLTGTPAVLGLGWSPETGVVLGWAGAEGAGKVLNLLGIGIETKEV